MLEAIGDDTERQGLHLRRRLTGRQAVRQDHSEERAVLEGRAPVEGRAASPVSTACRVVLGRLALEVARPILV
jgi:hypothetical protein